MNDLAGSDKFDWEKVIGRATVLPPGPTLVAYALMQWASPKGENVRPGIALLSRTTRLSERSVRRHLATLRDYGLIEKVANGSSFTGYADVYRMTTSIEGLDRLALWPLRGTQPVDNPVDNPVLDDVSMGQVGDLNGPKSTGERATSGPPTTMNNQLTTNQSVVVTSPPAGEGDAKIIFLGSRRAVR
ncbi:MAG: hypothetical protein H7146_03020 [Burkholderiaceae bacterium]|nr:hypothetical protein [Microbacteriaceae bacterium]